MLACDMGGVSEREFKIIAAQLGRPPRGVRAVETTCPVGHPQTIRVYPLVDGEPFPTLYWLTCPETVRQISRLEHQGSIPKIEELIASDAAFRARYLQNHRTYIAERWRELSRRDRRWIRDQGLLEVFLKRGIGGLEDWTKVKCLHLHYAHHLARENVIGEWIDGRYEITGCAREAPEDESL